MNLYIHVGKIGAFFLLSFAPCVGWLQRWLTDFNGLYVSLLFFFLSVGVSLRNMHGEHCERQRKWDALASVRSVPNKLVKRKTYNNHWRCSRCCCYCWRTFPIQFDAMECVRARVLYFKHWWRASNTHANAHTHFSLSLLPFAAANVHMEWKKLLSNIEIVGILFTFMPRFDKAHRSVITVNRFRAVTFTLFAPDSCGHIIFVSSIRWITASSRNWIGFLAIIQQRHFCE